MGREDFTWGGLMPLDFTMPTQFHGILSTIAPLDILDILIVAVILYRVYVMLEDTRAITLAKGILVLLGVTVVASYFNLHVISWLLQKSVTLLFVALPIVFQPELRRALELRAPESDPADDDPDALRRELARAKMEREIVKKAAAYFAKESLQGTRS